MAGKVAIVTGAAQGLGAVTARALARHGARVMVTDVSPTGNAVDSILEAGGDAMGMAADVTSQASVATLVTAVLGRWGRVDILVNNAAISGKLELQLMVELSRVDKLKSS